ncbi:MAG TPA: TIGR03936 family radical SAM-associated protein [Bacillota bacterium]|nr:TIGR03936 family radical SAM-associated protein [Bacillota bacterium]
MSRYVIKFSKEGMIRYISHLDLLRLFKRSFKRVGIRLQHSQGFNPHPKMSFAQPLSLGYFSTGEYLEFDTVEPYPTDEILEKINSVMPEGVHVFSCRELPAAGKTLAALTEYADYEIRIPLSNGSEEKSAEKSAAVLKSAEGYLSQENIFMIKHQKKSGKDIEIDIRPMIAEFKCQVDDNHIMITTKLAAGSTANLSPEAVLSTFCEFAGTACDRAEVAITRTEIYFAN